MGDGVRPQGGILWWKQSHGHQSTAGTQCPPAASQPFGGKPLPLHGTDHTEPTQRAPVQLQAAPALLLLCSHPKSSNRLQKAPGSLKCFLKAVVGVADLPLTFSPGDRWSLLTPVKPGVGEPASLLWAQKRDCGQPLTTPRHLLGPPVIFPTSDTLVPYPICLHGP